ncbi:hypothetical protein N0B31_17515 [Salinirubellus salinus]|uniref:Uncharacterized protein n=1 Tax=Salinirubellus salinus TaxID=1364945 RepID=A0A9E7UA64_9EURY|nr:hypothetical protein [Salinirubellus salinus]UWM53913.1 hypothetical protein N0B31_17515 [Salinirubellus salinus]
MSSSKSSVLEGQSVSRLGWLAVALVAVTGVIHVYAGVVEGRIPVALAGVGFLAAIGLYLADYRRPLLYLVGVVYTAIQIPLWYVVKAGEFTTIGYVDKAVQVVLVVVLAYLYWQTRTATTDSPTASHAG